MVLCLNTTKSKPHFVWQFYKLIILSCWLGRRSMPSVGRLSITVRTVEEVLGARPTLSRPGGQWPHCRQTFALLSAWWHLLCRLKPANHGTDNNQRPFIDPISPEVPGYTNVRPTVGSVSICSVEAEALAEDCSSVASWRWQRGVGTVFGPLLDFGQKFDVKNVMITLS